MKHALENIVRVRNKVNTTKILSNQEQHTKSVRHQVSTGKTDGSMQAIAWRSSTWTVDHPKRRQAPCERRPFLRHIIRKISTLTWPFLFCSTECFPPTLTRCEIKLSGASHPKHIVHSLTKYHCTLTNAPFLHGPQKVRWPQKQRFPTTACGREKCISCDHPTTSGKITIAEGFSPSFFFFLAWKPETNKYKVKIFDTLGIPKSYPEIRQHPATKAYPTVHRCCSREQTPWAKHAIPKTKRELKSLLWNHKIINAIEVPLGWGSW